MLVISRRSQESLLIGEEIEIVVLEIGKTAIKLGINAPRHIKVIRSELPPDPKKTKDGDD